MLITDKVTSCADCPVRSCNWCDCPNVIWLGEPDSDIKFIHKDCPFGFRVPTLEDYKEIKEGEE